ncbi:hypothetical protein ACVGVM_20250 [Pseudonocardia bannensis]|uniref:Uncharacterized protein n=1 Tax=Pseudonocardia bannensis TaxID=630973 RepID=A0A848DFD2_9PSEU|nr:hypothetical protein [Pseudonocardia bannensis]NMH91279.1 hypothetical protein [Pseudonocardia bannensis]
MKDIPVNLGGYKLTVVEAPAPKMRETKDGAMEPVVDRNGVQQFVVALFAKLKVGPGERAPKGEELRVTLTCDPGEGFAEDTRVELVDARLNSYQIDSPDGRSISGVSFKAMGLKPARTDK